MKIFSAAQIKQWDAFTIAHEPVASTDLMERAAAACCQWIVQQQYAGKHFYIFCGKGNNGGDGLVIARMLITQKYPVTVYILEFGNMGTTDFQTNLARLHECSTAIHFIQSADFFPVLKDDTIIIDALFGTGLNKPLESISAALVQHINQAGLITIAIDLPSGLSADLSSKGHAAIKATHTLSFQNYKLAFLLPENEDYCGEVHLLNIGLHKKFETETAAALEVTSMSLIRSIYKPRKPFAHKGNFGNAALVCGSYGMMGAAVLAAMACLKSGAGKLTCYIPACGYTIMQTAVPEAMCKVCGEEYIVSVTGMQKFDAIGIGPGMGTGTANIEILKNIFAEAGPVLVDADALNTIALNKDLLQHLPQNSILTPHPKEFERLFGKTVNDVERLQLALQKSKELQVYIILKGRYAFIATPGGQGYFNNTGNPGMATAGSGDVLSGIITGLLAQKYTSLQACIMGTWLHGLAGDIAAAKFSQEAMVAGDIAQCLGDAFKTLY